MQRSPVRPTRSAQRRTSTPPASPCSSWKHCCIASHSDSAPRGCGSCRSCKRGKGVIKEVRTHASKAKTEVKTPASAATALVQGVLPRLVAHSPQVVHALAVHGSSVINGVIPQLARRPLGVLHACACWIESQIAAADEGMQNRAACDASGQDVQMAAQCTAPDVPCCCSKGKIVNTDGVRASKVIRNAARVTNTHVPDERQQPSDQRDWRPNDSIRIPATVDIDGVRRVASRLRHKVASLPMTGGGRAGSRRASPFGSSAVVVRLLARIPCDIFCCTRCRRHLVAWTLHQATRDCCSRCQS